MCAESLNNQPTVSGETEDIVNKPSHYQSHSSDPKLKDLQTEDCMRVAFGEVMVKTFYLCNAHKYISRSPYKGKNTDIKKAAKCLERFLALGGFDD